MDLEKFFYNPWIITIVSGIVVGLILYFGFGIGKRSKEKVTPNFIRKGIVLNGNSKATVTRAKINNQSTSLEINDNSELKGRDITIR